ncbi:MAG: hypothetical protein QXW98_07750 [Candidatus Caldarchaeum sp.]
MEDVAQKGGFLMPPVEDCPQKTRSGGAKIKPDCPKTDFRQTPVDKRLFLSVGIHPQPFVYYPA